MDPEDDDAHQMQEHDEQMSKMTEQSGLGYTYKKHPKGKKKKINTSRSRG